MSRLVNSPSALPSVARVVERVQESPRIFTLRLCITDPGDMRPTVSCPDSSTCSSLFGVGEVPISIVSDPQDEQLFDHTVRALGRVTNGLAALKTGDRLGIRGPYRARLAAGRGGRQGCG